MSARRLTENESRQATSLALRTAGWGIVIYAAARLVAVVFASASMAAAVGQAVVAEWGAGRVGVAWSDPHAPMPKASDIARRAIVGAAAGTLAVVLVIGFGWATRAVLLERAAPASLSLVAVGLVTAGLHAMRDELLLHGVTLRAITSVRSPVARALACGATSLAAALGDPEATVRVALAALALGTSFGALWVRDRGAWMAWGAHTAWLFGVGTLLQGGVAVTKVASSSWGGGDAGVVGGTAAVLALASFAAVALAVARRGERAAPG